jgi:hypothetical protein
LLNQTVALVRPGAIDKESMPYGGYLAGENDALSPDNTVFWDENSAISRT